VTESVTDKHLKFIRNGLRKNKEKLLLKIVQKKAKLISFHPRPRFARDFVRSFCGVLLHTSSF
jgi:hypothetical protein